jgi:hypothetical protein
MYPKPVEPVSHARRRLITLIEARRFTFTLTEWGLSKSVIFASYETALGKRQPTYGVIFALREHIPPELWFYDEAEKPPEPVTAAVFLYSPADKGKREKTALRRKVLRDETAALGKLREIMEKRELSSFAGRHGVKYQDLWQVCNKRKKPDGRYGYHQRVPFRVVKALREVIHPALWYIFPDELT